ncbi:unnamed protein product [Alopecurus aequalis]
MADVQDAVGWMVRFLPILVGIYLIGSSVSDPSSLIQTLETIKSNNSTTVFSSNNSTLADACTPRHLAGHFTTLAFDVHFLAVSLVLVAGLVFAVKMTVDKGAKAEDKTRATEEAAASAAAAESTRLTGVARTAEEDSAKAETAEGNAKLAAGHKRRLLDQARTAASLAHHQAAVATQALDDAARELNLANAAVQQANHTPRADAAAAGRKAIAAAKAADDATTAASRAKEDAAKAAQHFQATQRSLDEAEVEAATKIAAAKVAKEEAEKATKEAEEAAAVADAAKPAVGIARFSDPKRILVRFCFSLAILVSVYSSLAAIASFDELLKYKTECLGSHLPTGLNKHILMSIALQTTHWLIVIVFSYLHLCFAYVALWKY